ncbi:MAG: bifunctional folylpolyglutamate synthase/dihydrofolate synthase [Rhodospirillales bacterium]|nr:bifunctional folylpolyglutamate synthase/dihydrofolate synthase [Rhodospirillales bacterium]
MYDADACHSSPALDSKLRALYGLRRGGRLELGFRAPYLALLESFGHPHLALPPVIHVAGTNGKGSTIAFLRAILESAGYRVHAYTSPHLVRFNERIRLAGVEISDGALESLLDEAVEKNAGGETTFFEITTALAFAAFARVPADVLLLETGLGGRLDCTNIVPAPLATLITAISGDHREFLGETLDRIAAEKAGIMKPGAPCIVGPQPMAARKAGVMEVFERRAGALGVDLLCSGAAWSCAPEGEGMVFRFGDQTESLPAPGLPGFHQYGNAGAALAALAAVGGRLPVSAQARAEGMRSVDWPARLDHITGGVLAGILPHGWFLWLDGGHNDSAGAALADQARAWAQEDGRPLHLIVGMMGSKHPAEFLGPLFPYVQSLSAVPIVGEGAGMPPGAILGIVPQGIETAAFESVPAALRALAASGKPPARILICGSLYLAGEVLRGA